MVRLALLLSLPVALPLQQPRALRGRGFAPVDLVPVVQCPTAFLYEREDEDEVDEAGEGEVCQDPAVLPSADQPW